MRLEAGFIDCVMPLSLLNRHWQGIIASYNARVVSPASSAHYTAVWNPSRYNRVIIEVFAGNSCFKWGTTCLLFTRGLITQFGHV